MIKKIPLCLPSITDKEKQYVAEAVANGWGENWFYMIERFEKSFKDFLGVKYAVATSSCTGAIHLALAGLDVGKGDEVIVADSTWIATVAPIVHLKAKPIFVDILPDSWCIDPNKVEQAISRKTKAIIAVHLYGNSCEMSALIEIGKRYNIAIIEDAAEGFGTKFNDQYAGTMASCGVFSFHGSKTMTTGEGGMFVTNDYELYQRVLTLSNHGRSMKEKKEYWPEVVGYKFKMSNIQAALGCAQLERANELINRKRNILSFYREQFDKYSEISTNYEPDNVINGAWMPTLVFSEQSGVTREILKDAFQKEQIDARIFFWPLSCLSFFNEKVSNNVAHSISKRAINLPSFHDISEQELHRVCGVIHRQLQ